MNREQQERLMEKIEYDIKSDMIAQEEKKKIKRSECPYGGIDCAWCGEAEPCIYRIANKLQEQLNRKEEELQAQRNFTAQEQRKIYCVAYDKTCETGNECKQKKCVFKDRLKYKQALDEIQKYLDAQQKYFDGEDYHNLLDIINKVKE